MTLVADIVLRRLGRADYLPTLEAMRRFTRERDEGTVDELWLLVHPVVMGEGRNFYDVVPAGTTLELRTLTPLDHGVVDARYAVR